jgi:hypothetical protein
MHFKRTLGIEPQLRGIISPVFNSGILQGLEMPMQPWLTAVKAVSRVRLKRHGEIGEEMAQCQHRLHLGKRAYGGGSLAEARVHCHLQTGGRYRGSWWKSTRKVAGWENFLVGL